MATGVLLNTRPANYRARFHAAFAGIAWPIVDCPVLTAVPTAAPLPPAENFDAVVFTSQVAVALFDDAPSWRMKTVFAVGAGTAEAARAAGFARTIQTGMDGEDLSAHLVDADFERALYPSAEDVSIDLAAADRDRIRRIAIYRMEPRTALPDALLSAAGSGQPILTPLFSKRSADTLAALLLEAGLTAANSRMAAIGISSDVLPVHGGPWQWRAVADKPTLDAVVIRTREMAAEMGSEATT